MRPAVFLRAQRCVLLPMVFTLAGALSPADVAGQSPGSREFAVEQRLMVASKIYASIPLYFAHWADLPKGFNLDSTYSTYLSRTLAAKDRYEFDMATMEFVAAFGNIHTAFWDNWLGEQYGQPIGFFAVPLEGKWVITSSQNASLKPGEVIRSIDGQPLDAFFAARRKYINSFSETSAKHLFFYSAFLFPHQFDVITSDGRVTKIDRRTQTLTPVEPVRAETRLEGKIGYMKLPSFGVSAVEDSAIAFVRRNRDAEALVIDVRGNTGGSTPGRLVRLLMDRPYRWWGESTPAAVALNMQTRPNSQLHWDAVTSRPDTTAAFRGKIVLITDALCGSACEDFVMPFKDTGRGRVVGTTTMGSTGQPYFLTFPNGMSVRIGMKREYFPDGSQFEGRGIEPDVLMRPTIESLAKREDVVLARAMELAKH